MAKGLQGPEWFPGGMSPLSLAESGISGLATPTPFPLLCPPPLCPKQAAPVPLAPAGLTGGQAVSTSGYHPSHILLPQHPFPNGNEAVWWNQEGKSTTFNNTPPVSSNTPKAPALRHATALCGFLCLPGFVETRGQSAGPTGAKVKWGTSSVPRKTSAAREILFHQITCLTAGNTACGRVQGLPAFTCLLPALCGVVVSSP